MTGKRKGPKPGTLRAPRITVVCYTCFREFPVTQGVLDIGGGKFCGKPCYYEYRRGKRREQMPKDARFA